MIVAIIQDRYYSKDDNLFFEGDKQGHEDQDNDLINKTIHFDEQGVRNDCPEKTLASNDCVNFEKTCNQSSSHFYKSTIEIQKTEEEVLVLPKINLLPKNNYYKFQLLKYRLKKHYFHTKDM